MRSVAMSVPHPKLLGSSNGICLSTVCATLFCSDKWIEKVKRCEYLAEDELKSLCEYVSGRASSSCACRCNSLTCGPPAGQGDLGGGVERTACAWPSHSECCCLCLGSYQQKRAAFVHPTDSLKCKNYHCICMLLLLQPCRVALVTWLVRQPPPSVDAAVLCSIVPAVLAGAKELVGH